MHPLRYRLSVYYSEFATSYNTAYWNGKLYRTLREGAIFNGAYFYHPEYISLGNGTVIHKGTLMEVGNNYGISKNGPKLVVGNHCHIGEYNHFTATNRIEIGDGLLTGRYVLITDNSHGDSSGVENYISPTQRRVVSKGTVIIGKNVWLGDKVSIMANVRIGDGVIVAANSVVTHDIPSYSVVAGVPAKIIKKLPHQSM